MQKQVIQICKQSYGIWHKKNVLQRQMVTDQINFFYDRLRLDLNKMNDTVLHGVLVSRLEKLITIR